MYNMVSLKYQKDSLYSYYSSLMFVVLSNILVAHLCASSVFLCLSSRPVPARLGEREGRKEKGNG